MGSTIYAFNPTISAELERKTKQHLRSAARLLETMLKPYAIRVEAPRDPNSHIIASMADGGHIDGMVYKNHINCLSRLLSRVVTPIKGGFEYRANHVCLTSLTQTGKTTLLNAMSFMPPIIWLLTGEKTLVVRFLINDCGLEHQANEEANNFIKLYGEFKLSRHGSSPITINGYMENAKRTAPLDCDINPVGCMIRTSPSTKSYMARLWEVTQQSNFHPIITVDESHARSDTGSPMEEMLQQARSEHQHWLSKGFSFFGMSATNFALGHTLIGLGYRPPVFLEPGDNYTGYPYEPVEGRPVRVSVVPKVMTIEELADRAGTTLYEFQVDEVANEDKFLNRNPGGDFVSHQKRFCQQFAATWRWLFKNNPADGRGGLVRLYNNNTTTTQLVERLRPLMPEVALLVYNTDYDNHVESRTRQTKSLKNFIRQQVKPGQKYLVFVTGRGRMGTAAPTDLRYGIDFTRKSIFSALLQGIAGRLTGYNKGETWVVLSDSNARLLNHFIRTGDYGSRSPHPHIGGEFDEDRKSFRRYANHFLPSHLDKLSDIVNAAYRKGNKQLHREKGYENEFIPWNLLDDEELRKIEAENNFRICRPGEKVSGDTYVENTKDGKVNVVVSNVTDGRLRSITQISAARARGKSTPRMSIEVVVKDDRFEIVAVNYRTYPYSVRQPRVKPISIYSVPTEEGV